MDHSIARKTMVDTQIRPNQVDDEVALDAILATPREAFLPRALHGVAYSDGDLPLGGGRFVMEPLVLARLLQAAAIQADDIVLAIGCATGYSAAVLSHMAGTVVAVESESALVEKATNNLSGLEIDTVAVMQSDLKKGYPKQGPFDLVFFDGAVDQIPADISDQLAENGRLVAVIKAAGEVGKGVLMTRRNGALNQRDVFNADIPYLPGFEPAAEFEF